jgi:transcriptional regulator with XRE-family HTH domain
MLIIGNQLRAARALAEVDQQWVAERSGVSVNTIRNMESRVNEPITSGAVTLRKVQIALETAGVEFTNGGQPGVRVSAEMHRLTDDIHDLRGKINRVLDREGAAARRDSDDIALEMEDRLNGARIETLRIVLANLERRAKALIDAKLASAHDFD